MNRGALLETYRDKRLLLVLAQGFASGLPLALTASTLTFWLSKEGVSKSSIGLFALVGTAYSVKFLWAPFLDRLAAPMLGRRRFWLLVSQIGLIMAMIGTGLTTPAIDPWWTALGAVSIAFFSASQDIVIDAYRVEILDERRQGAGAAVTQYGYRIGLLVSGAGALWLSEYLPWSLVYAVMAALMALFAILTLFSPEPPRALGPNAASAEARGWRSLVIEPFASFARHRAWGRILLFVILFKLGDAIAGVMTSPFYVDLGFSAGEVASVTKVFGLIATLLGIFLGGWLVGALGLGRALLIGGVLQGASTAMYIVQAHAGHDTTMLAGTVFIENATGGMGSAAFVAYLSSLCAREFTATHYALLSALATVGRTSLASAGGFIVDAVGWETFFAFSVLAAVPGLLLLLTLMPSIRRTEAPAGAAAAVAD